MIFLKRTSLVAEWPPSQTEPGGPPISLDKRSSNDHGTNFTKKGMPKEAVAPITIASAIHKSPFALPLALPLASVVIQITREGKYGECRK